MASGASYLLLRVCLILFGVCCTSASSLTVSPQHAWSTYKGLLKSRPLLTKAATSAILSGVSDSMTQQVESKLSTDEENNFHHDWIRSSHIMLTGFAYSGPMSHYWFALLERIVTIEDPILGLIFRLTLDALVFSPCTVAGYFAVRTLLEGKGYAAIRTKLERTWRKAVFAAWKFWPAVNVINYSFVPLPYRVLYVNIMALLWTGYLSFVNTQKKQEAK